MQDIIVLLSIMTVLGFQSYMLVTLLLNKYGDYKQLKHNKRFACDDTCMCGDSIDSHGWGTGHAAVSQWDHTVVNFKPTLRGGV